MLEHIDGQVADLFTKGLDGKKLGFFCEQLGMVNLIKVGVEGKC